MSGNVRTWRLAGVGAVLIAGAVAFDLIHARATREPPNWSLVEPGLYMGGRVPRPPPDVRAVLNLSMLEDEYGAEALGKDGVHRWEGIADGEPVPTLEWLRNQVEFVDAQRRAGLTVFVHCDAGRSRSGLVTTAYLMWRDHLPRDEAIGVIRLKREAIQPNQWFLALLAEWEKELKGGGKTKVGG
jgi:protein-tyrosine phosphatase